MAGLRARICSSECYVLSFSCIASGVLFIKRFLIFPVLVSICVLLILPVLSGIGNAKIPLLVTTKNGPVIGAFSIEGQRVYKGIPYAKPPVGQLRWKAPQQPDPWKLPLLCDAFKSSCPSYPLASDVDLQLETFDEDCLYLNVWTDADDASSLLPVMVFIHGGSFLTGSATKRVYNGAYLAERGVVVVTINYRLGAFGVFFWTR
jgi:para-nitrobenzyl esterase